MQVYSYYDGNGSTVASKIENIVFQTGTSWDLTSGLRMSDTDTGHSLYGAGGADIMDGNGGNDTLYGYGGNDILYTSSGTDTLYGNAGADTFMFEAATAFSNSDSIMDFSTGQSDKIDISDVLDGFYNPLSHAITDFVEITTSGSNSLLKIDQDGTANGVNFVQVATLYSITGLTDEAAQVSAGRLIVA